VRSATLGNVYGVSSVIAVYTGRYHGAAPALFSAMKITRWLRSIISRSVGQSPSNGPR
jgi:hypothetical protein